MAVGGRTLALAGAAAAAAILFWIGPFSRPEPREAGAGAEMRVDPVPEPEPATPPPSPSAGSARKALSIDSGATLEIEAQALPTSGPLAVELLFPEPSTATALPVRILSEDGRILHLQAGIPEQDARRASVEIPPDWLSPGRYVVELKTTERTHLPLRRYALEVR
jgi:hypothetical protein